MEIHRVVRDLAMTKRNFWLAAMPMRVVEDYKGNHELALDQIGFKPGDFVITSSVARIAAVNPMMTTDITIGGIIDCWSEADWPSSATGGASEFLFERNRTGVEYGNRENEHCVGHDPDPRSGIGA